MLRGIVMMVAALAGLTVCGAEKERVLFFPAHPDDIISSVGTILLMRDKFEVHVCDFTCGAPGTKPEYYALRRSEEEKVCRALGATLHWYDTERDSRWVEEKPCKRFAELLKELKPRAVFGHWPIESHSDHMMSCAVLQKAVQLAKLGCEFYFFEESYDSKGFLPAHYVDISGVVEEKKRIIRLYESQNKDDLLVKFEMRNSAIRGERLRVVNPEDGFSVSMYRHAEAFATYGGRPQGPIIFAELPQKKPAGGAKLNL